MATAEKLYKNAIINGFIIKSDSVDVLKDAIRIAFSSHSLAIGHIKTKNILTIYWRETTDVIKFQKPLNIESCFEFVHDWLKSIKPEDRLLENKKLQVNGDYGFGFKISSDNDSDYELFEIKCMNLYYGK